MAKIKLTLLSNMLGQDFIQALDQHVALGLTVLDLKTEIFGKQLIDLSNAEAERAAQLIAARNLSVYCFSSVLFYDDVELGEAAFRDNHLAKVDRLLELADILKPQLIRLLAAKSKRRSDFPSIHEYVLETCPWLIPMYREAIAKIHRRGFQATLENEVHGCIFSTPEEILAFFRELDCGDQVSLTYDVQNLWQMGTFPTIATYEKLSGLTRYLHLKGGQLDPDSGRPDLRWCSTLEDASWPVLDLVRRSILDGNSPVICLNPSHGMIKDTFDYQEAAIKDIRFLRQQIPEVE